MRTIYPRRSWSEAFKAHVERVAKKAERPTLHMFGKPVPPEHIQLAWRAKAGDTAATVELLDLMADA